jgi:fatty acid desaturase
VEGYARVHLAHHRDYFSEGPDFLRKSGEEWSIPKAPEACFALPDRRAGAKYLEADPGQKRSDAQFAFARRFRIPKWVRPAYYLVVASVLTLTESWALFLVYWLLPLLTVSPALVRWGAICEHKYNLPGASVAESTPLIILQWWERLLIPNLNFGMHPYHHFFPGVSFSKLPRVHQIFCREGLVNHDNIFFGNASFLRFITTPRVAAAAEAGQPSVTQ